MSTAALTQKAIDERLLRHAKDFIPQLVEFKLSSVIHGSNTQKSDRSIFPDSPLVGKTYVPKKLKQVMEQLAKGDLNLNQAYDENDKSEDSAEDYEMKERPHPKKVYTNNERGTFIPMNVFDLYEQAKINPETKKQVNLEKKSGWDDSSDDDIIIDGQNEKRSALLVKRKKLEKLQENDQAWNEGTVRERDEWDTAYDTGKQKKVRIKSDQQAAFNFQNQMFQNTYEERKQNKQQAESGEEQFKPRYKPGIHSIDDTEGKETVGSYFRGGRGGFRGGRGGDFRGGFRSGFRGDSRGSFRGGRGDFRGSFRGGRGDFRGGSRGSFGGRGGSRGGFKPFNTHSSPGYLKRVERSGYDNKREHKFHDKNDQ